MAAAASCIKHISWSGSRGKGDMMTSRIALMSLKPDLCHITIPDWKVAMEKEIGMGFHQQINIIFHTMFTS